MQELYQHLLTISLEKLIMSRDFKVLKIDHIAIAVSNSEIASSLFTLLGMEVGNSEVIKSEKVSVVKVKTLNKNHTVELLEPLDKYSVVDKFIQKKGQGLHHIALEVDNIINAITYLEKHDIKLIYSTPQKGADNKLITFIHPSSTPGILLELCQSV